MMETVIAETSAEQNINKRIWNNFGNVNGGKDVESQVEKPQETILSIQI